MKQFPLWQVPRISGETCRGLGWGWSHCRRAWGCQVPCGGPGSPCGLSWVNRWSELEETSSILLFNPQMSKVKARKTKRHMKLTQLKHDRAAELLCAAEVLCVPPSARHRGRDLLSHIVERASWVHGSTLNVWDSWELCLDAYNLSNVCSQVRGHNEPVVVNWKSRCGGWLCKLVLRSLLLSWHFPQGCKMAAAPAITCVPCRRKGTGRRQGQAVSGRQMPKHGATPGT